mmetsp:Transcript_33785/g.55240  ORF Transcript_33785/g.55240 Transcript_33785/m.55240 type:complete len:85 (-) Transcript_33785:174-428(-)
MLHRHFIPSWPCSNLKWSCFCAMKMLRVYEKRAYGANNNNEKNQNGPQNTPKRLPQEQHIAIEKRWSWMHPNTLRASHACVTPH